jgi:hypothetical protein
MTKEKVIEVFESNGFMIDLLDHDKICGYVWHENFTGKNSRKRTEIIWNNLNSNFENEDILSIGLILPALDKASMQRRLALKTLSKLPQYFNEEDVDEYPDALELCLVVLDRIAEDKV